MSIVNMEGERNRRNIQHNQEGSSTSSSASSTSAVEEDENPVNPTLPLNSSEQALIELRKLRDYLQVHLDTINRPTGRQSCTNIISPENSSSSSSTPPDPSLLDVPHEGRNHVSVLFEMLSRPAERESVDNLFPPYRRILEEEQQRDRSEAVGGASASHQRRMMTDQEIADLQERFDIPVESKPALIDIQKLYTEEKIESNKKICELNAEVTVKAKESEFLEYHLAKSHTELHIVKSEVAKKEAENKKLRQEISDVESRSSRRILELTLDLQQKSSKLEMYEKLFCDMEHIAESDHTGVQAGSGFTGRMIGGSVSSSFKLKLQESMDLAQRLKEERDHLERCRDEADRKLKEMETKYQGTLIDLNKYKIAEDSKLISAKAALKLKTFELERAELVMGNYKQKHEVSLKANEELKKKVECLTEHLNDTRLELNEENTRLNLQLQTKTSKLELYEKIEDTMDEMIVKAAAVPNADIGNDLLNFCSGGTPLPTDSRRRLQQAFDLAKRNCKLEKAVAEQKSEIMTLYDERQALRQEMDTMKSLRSHSVTQLLETITQKNREITKLNSRIGSVERDFCDMKQNNELLQNSIENLKGYQEQLVTLYHAGACAGQAKYERDMNNPKVQDTSQASSPSTNRKSSNRTVTSHYRYAMPASSSSSVGPTITTRYLASTTPSRNVEPVTSTEYPAPTTRSPTIPTTLGSSGEAVSSRASLRFRRSRRSDGRQHSVSATKTSTSKGSQERIYSEYDDSRPPSTSDSVNTFHGSGSRLLLESSLEANSGLRAITEESDNDSTSSITSSMLFPQASMERNRSPVRMSVRSTPASKSSSASTRSKNCIKVTFEKAVPSRQSASASTLSKAAKKKEKPVPLRFTKVKPSSSSHF